MQYDPIKDSIFHFISLFPDARRLFYTALDFLLLRQRYVKREIKRYFQDGMRFYDAGAGFCQYSDFVLHSYPSARVFATDLKTDYLANYASFSDERFSFQTADLQDFKPKYSYDLAIAIDILEHIPDDLGALSNLHHALADDGVLIVSTPSDLDEAAKYAAEHVRPGYDKAQLEAKLEQSGFRILKSIYSYGILGALAWRLQMKYPLKMLSKSRFSIFFLALWYPLTFPLCQILMTLDMMRENKRGTGLIIVAQKSAGFAPTNQPVL